MRRTAGTATLESVRITLMLAGLNVIGSCHLAHVDAALIAHTAAVLCATCGLTSWYAMWLQATVNSALLEE
jgi:hypothetical protein